ncbi:MAG: TauD/TfdA family dioxygenase [Alphaproteobacteria bacterium]|nr:TauD/TfdA family dioxygenase [Alphaproteobacteria bacterium]
MAPSLRPLHKLFVAEARGIDLTRKLTADLAAEIEAAMDRHAVLVFPDQPIDEDQQVAFTEWFGPLDTGLLKVFKRKSRFKHGAMIAIGNVNADGEVVEPGERLIVSQMANQLWHSDSSFQRVPGKYSILAAQVVPASGGDTEWVDQRAAHDALPEDLRALAEGRVAEHSAFYTRLWLGDTYSEAELAIMPLVRWPLVRTHPGSGRRTLFLGAHAQAVVGMSRAEGRMLLRELTEHATQPAFVYRHQWRPGDVVMWDNRCTLHRGRRYDLAARRELRRTTSEDLISAREQWVA